MLVHGNGCCCWRLAGASKNQPDTCSFFFFLFFFSFPHIIVKITQKYLARHVQQYIWPTPCQCVNPRKITLLASCRLSQVEGNVGPLGKEKPSMSFCVALGGGRSRRDSSDWVGLKHCHVSVVAVLGCGEAAYGPQGLGHWDS